jgi:hypothetical protein
MNGNGIQGPLQQERWCFPWWIKNDRVFEFEFRMILVRDVMCQNHHIKNDHGMLLLSCFCGIDKGPPLPTTFIDTLFKIVRGRRLVRRSSANDHFLQQKPSFCALEALFLEFLQLCRFSSAWYMTKRGTWHVTPHATILL